MGDPKAGRLVSNQVERVHPSLVRDALRDSERPLRALRCRAVWHICCSAASTPTQKAGGRTMVARRDGRGRSEMSLNPGTRLAVFSIRTGKKGGSIWVRAGSAFVNRDNSLNVLLDVLPMDGRLHLREAAVERREAAPVPPDVAASLEVMPVEGHS
jgi:hypothetical protein